jgi:exosortase/archaeosortase family protein
MRLSTQRVRFLAGLLLLLAGIQITITLDYMPRCIGVILIIFGLGILVLTARKRPEEKEEAAEKEEKKTLADILIGALILSGKLTVILPAIGVFLIVFVFVFNYLFRGNLDQIGVNDTITILLGLTLIFYNYVPKRFDRERDFVFLFFIFLFLILVVPLTLYSLISGPIRENSNSPFIYHLLARPTSDLLNVFGISSTVHSVPPQLSVEGIPLSDSGVYVVYKNLGEVAMAEEGGWSAVLIGISCTGLYSVSIFISGFIAFILIEYRRLDIRVASLLTLGVVTSWFANILRMTIIVAVGSYHGKDALLWTHANVGIFIFMLWIGIFWAVMFKLLMPRGSKIDEEEPEGEAGDDSTGEIDGE